MALQHIVPQPDAADPHRGARDGGLRPGAGGAPTAGNDTPTLASLADYARIFPVTPGEMRIPVPIESDDAEMRGAFTATVIRARATTTTAPIGSFERHPFSVQAFVPLGACRLVALAAPRGAPPTSIDQVVGIRIPAGYGIAWHPGVWHAGLMGDGIDAPVLAMVRRIPGGADTEFTDLPFSINPALEFGNAR